ncbi:rab-like protein 3 [Pollicipes pollicipes]|uniref:rab-like protein 3 n=1 Tax=Pollicipes pollicipes TaxID=41117 RepID=UPI001884BC95|nr:rab-like protein 3 [Pollicipes pollicipes]
MNDIETVKVVVVGDSGVGKTSLVHLICHNEPCPKPSWTIGCELDVRIHDFREGLPAQRTYCVELWDVGGSAAHQNARHVFYGGAHGVILVHDRSNRKTQNTLGAWLAEVLQRDGGGGEPDAFDLETLAAPRSLAAGSGNAVKLSRFFDKVIERRYYGDRTAQQYERRRPTALGHTAVSCSFKEY